MAFDFDQHKRDMAREYAQIIHKHPDLPAIKAAIWDRAKELAKTPLYADFTELLREAVRDNAKTSLPDQFQQVLAPGACR